MFHSCHALKKDLRRRRAGTTRRASPWIGGTKSGADSGALATRTRTRSVARGDKQEQQLYPRTQAVPRDREPAERGREGARKDDDQAELTRMIGG